MPSLYDVPADALIDALAEELADRLEEPEWARHVKAGADRELPPDEENFWNRRAASVLRTVAIDGPVGVERLRTRYGGTKEGSNRYRVAPSHHAKGSGKIIRTILQQLQEEGLVEEAGSAGRIVSADGRSLLDRVAGDLLEDLAEERPELERYV